MSPADDLHRPTLALVGGLALAIVLTPLLAPWLAVFRLRGELPAAARIARPSGASPPADVREVLATLAVDPELRAAEALYRAALRVPGPARLRFASTSAPPGSRIVAALAAADALLRTPSAQSAVPSEPGLAAAAAATGVDVLYLRRTAQAESGFNPFARATTSSARGLFQFIEQTWLRAVARWGARHGLVREAQLVRFDRAGRAYVADAVQARAILALRYDPDLSARMAAELARENAAVLAGALGRPALSREIYAAHLFGTGGALRLIRAAEVSPALPAVRLLPEAAASNERLFFRAGSARSVADLLGSLP